MKNNEFRLWASMCLILTAAIFVGCTAFESRRVEPFGAVNAKTRSGIAYFLPTGKIHVIATKTEVRETNDLVQLPGTNGLTGIRSNSWTKVATTTSPAAGTAPTLITNIVTTINLRTNNDKVTITATTQSTNTVEVIPASHAGEPQKTETNTEANSLVTVFGLKPEIKSRIVYQIMISEEYEKDGNQLFLLDPEYTTTSSDSFRVTVGANGLLTSINSTNEDDTGQILVELGKAAAEGFKLGVTGIPPSGEKLMTMEERKALPDRVDIVFDPFDEPARNRAKSKLKEAKLDLDLSAFEAQARYAQWTNVTGTAGGVFYRPTLPYEVRVESDSDFRSKTVYLPNEAPILSYNIRRAALVTATTQLSFSNGCLVEIAANKPSEALAAAKIPLQIIQSVASIPTNMLQLKFDVKSLTQKVQNLDTNTAALKLAETESQIRITEAQRRLANTTLTNDINAQLTAIEAQIRLLEAQTRLLNAQRAGGTNAGGN